MDNRHDPLQILINRKDGKSLMNDNNTDEILKMNRFIANNVTISNGFNLFIYHNICSVYCNDSNDIVLTFIKAAINMNDRFSSSLAFTFPKARIFEKYIFMGYSIVDLHYSEHDATIVDSFKLFILHFMINLNLPDGTRITKNFESQLRTLLTLATYECKDLEYVLFSRDREIEEQRKITLTALPFLGAIFAVLSPAMTLVTSCGILWNIGLPFSNILIVVLFLIIIIGVDDSFFILAAWRHSKVLNPKISSMDCDQKLYGMTRTNYILLILAFQYITLTNRCRRKYRRKYQERVISYLGTEVNTDFDIENLYLENLTMNAISRQLQHFNLSEAFVSILVFIQCQILLMFLFGINLIVWLKKLETIPKFGMGSNETVLWTRDFANAIAFWDDESNFWQQDKLLSTFREYEIDEKFVITEALGYLHLWNVRLDAISLISLIMSISFSVDYSAHICYHYVAQKVSRRSHQPISIIIGLDSNIEDLSIASSTNSAIHSNVDSRERFLVTFKNVGWPVMQSGLSTLSGILPMIMVKAYVVVVFWKTVLLLIVLGMIHALTNHFLNLLSIDYAVPELLPILNEAKKLFLTEPTLLDVEVPCVIIGDIHGQYEDLHRIFSVLGTGRKSGAVKRRFVFLGDYVDRGMNSLETICCLLAHKLMFPKMFNLLRGNHESPDINRTYGFQLELERRFPTNNEGYMLWNAFNELFACLPLAAIIHNKILCIHGGIGPELKSLNDIRKIKRPMQDPMVSSLACSLLWSDPMLDLKGFIKNSLRGAGYFFGEDTVIACCEQLNIDLIVRAHQNNKCAILQVEKDLRVGFILLCPVTPEIQGKLSF
ncbi:Serine/threonine-protein phosphatase [Dirofilaria immitis]|nr:Serine/threonine-protein phosphatase [Dirofilaria immitis]